LKGTPQTVFIKAKMNLKLLQNLWMICSQISEKSLIQQTSSLEIIDSLNRNTKQIIHTKINTMKTNFFTIITIVTTFIQFKRLPKWMDLSLTGRQHQRGTKQSS
jgi:hypothetical protein